MLKETEYWEKEIETLPIEELRKGQEERLRALVKRAYENTVFYRRKFDEAKVKPEDIKTLEDLQKLPLTHYIEDFVATPLEEKLAVGRESITQIMTTSGTISGFTQPIMMTEHDEEEMSNIFIRTIRMVGVRADDIVQLLFPYDLMVPMLSKLVSVVIPWAAGRGILDNQIKLAKLLKSTVVFVPPSYMVQFVNRASELGIDLKNETALRLALVAGEPLALPVRRRIEEESGISFGDLYGATETPVIGGECMQRDGLHIWADHHLIEIIDPETLEVLGTGEEGELVLTPLTKEAMPLIRYRTGDITKLLTEGVCPCGRTHPKIALVKGRVDHIIKVQGVRLLPIDVEDFVFSMPGLSNQYQIVVDKKGELDFLKLKIEHAPGVSDIKTLEREAKLAFERKTSLKCEIELVPPGTLPKLNSKPSE